MKINPKNDFFQIWTILIFLNLFQQKGEIFSHKKYKDSLWPNKVLFMIFSFNVFLEKFIYFGNF